MSMYHAVDIGASFLGVRRFLGLAATCVCLAASSDVLAAYQGVGKARGLL